MKNIDNTSATIESIVELYFSDQKDHRITYLFKESLFNLVRLAKAEQVLEMRQNVDRAMASRPSKHASMIGKTIDIN